VNTDNEENDRKTRQTACSIFGHLCPVFFVSEPFTETSILRNVSRHIPRPVLIRVVRRDNSTCQVCGKHLLDSEIQIDHIIPVTKGGPSIESNSRVICSERTLKKSKTLQFD
jgi:hypothetical protein